MRSLPYRFLKRTIDVLLATVALVASSPIIAITAIVILVTMGRPVLFRQERVGLNGKIFTVYKLRTMTSEVDDKGDLLPDDARLKGVGKIIRKTSLDEIPQLLNVFKGDMSLIGPRPLLVDYLPLYSPNQNRRHEVKPGITGWAQVNGRNTTSWEDRLSLDVWYVDNQSFSLDLRILWRTLVVVCTGSGVSQSGHVTMSRFTGSSEKD
ncbi:MAG: sugar transferase [Pseudomonadota bacterium]